MTQNAPSPQLSPSRRLRAPLAALLVGVNLLVLALSAYSLLQSRRQYELRAETMTQNIAGALDQRISASIEKIDLALRTVADELERQIAGKGIDAAAINAFLKRHEQRVPEIDGIRVADAEGFHILGRGVVATDKVGIADRNYFVYQRDHDDRSLHISKPVTGRIAKKQVMVAAQRYNYPDGRFAGVVIGAITVEHFTRLLSGFKLGANGILSLRDAELGLITRVPSQPDKASGQIGSKTVSEEGRRLFDSGIRLATFHTDNAVDGFERIFTFRHLDKAPMLVTAGVASEDYLSGWRTEVYKTSALVLGFLALSVLSGAFMWRVLDEAEHDVAERRRAECEQQRLNRSLRLLSDCNLAIVRAEGEDALLADVCRLIVDTGGYLMAWIGLAEQDAEKSVRPVAGSAGAGNYLDRVRISWDETQEIGRGPTGTAIRIGATQVNQSCRSNPAMAPWREAALGYGYQSNIALPLMAAERAFGALTIYAADTDAYTADEVALLEELARNIQFGILTLRGRREREEADTALRESAARYRILLDNLPQVIWQKDRASVYVSCNAAYARGLGIAPADLPGKTDSDFYPAPLAQKYRLDDQRVIEHGAIETLDEIWPVDGKEIPVRTTKVPLRDEHGNIYGTLGIADDVTLQKEAGRALEKNREQLEALVVARTEELAAARDGAEAAARAKSAFLANMSHEIRTPLAIIIGLGNVLRQKLREPALLKRLSQLCDTADHLSAVVNDILDLSKIDAGHLALDESDFRLGAVLDTVSNLTAELVRERGLSLEVEAAPKLRQTLLRGDAVRLRQVLINLAGNAAKFTERGSVSLSVEALAETVAGLRLRFAVRDTGIGIAAADQARLFLAYEQADSSLTRRHGGTGLGLAISQRLVALMGGVIAVDSRPGAGSSFSFELDIPRGSGQAELPPALSAMPDFSGARVLVAEDHPLNQGIMLDLLESFGCEAEFAGDGIEALECARSADYDLILMDLRMPRMDGLAATRAIRALPRHGATPILALTAGAFNEDRELCLEAGMNGHIGKPFTLPALVAALRQWLPDTGAAGQPARSADLDAALMAVPGLDASSLLRITARHPDGYKALLQRYADMHEGDMARLRQHLAAGDGDATRRVLHQLMGSSGFIGAKRIAALAAEIDAALRAGADAAALAPLLDRCALELASLIAAVRSMPETSSG